MNGLRNLPAIIHGSATIDTVEEIIDYIEEKFPSASTPKNVDVNMNDVGMNDVDVDKLTRNFFSRLVFCGSLLMEEIKLTLRREKEKSNKLTNLHRYKINTFKLVYKLKI